MKLEELSQVALERSSGIDRTTISRFLAGERVPSRDQLAQLLVGISGDRARQLELLFAHLSDEAAPAVRAGITEAHWVLRSADQGAPTSSLAAELELLGDESATDDNLRAVLVEMARMIRAHRAREADAAGTVFPFRRDDAASIAEANTQAAGPPRRSRSIGPVPKPPATG